MFSAHIMHLTETEFIPIDGFMNAQIHLRAIHKPIVTPMANDHGQNYILVNDNACTHKARILS